VLRLPTIKPKESNALFTRVFCKTSDLNLHIIIEFYLSPFIPLIFVFVYCWFFAKFGSGSVTLMANKLFPNGMGND